MPWRSIYQHVIREVVACSDLLPPAARIAALRRGGVSIGHGCRIEGGQHFVLGDVAIGDEVYINRDCLFDAYLTKIEIGDRATIGAGAIVAASSHEIGGPARRAGADRCAPIRIGDGVWLGARVTVLPGVSIGDGCVIGASSLVTENTEPNAVYAGTPARLMRHL